MGGGTVWLGRHSCLPGTEADRNVCPTKLYHYSGMFALAAIGTRREDSGVPRLTFLREMLHHAGCAMVPGGGFCVALVTGFVARCGTATAQFRDYLCRRSRL